MTLPSQPPIKSSSTKKTDWLGIACATLGAMLFSGKAIIVKIAYRDYAIDTESLLLLRMGFAAPIFLAILMLDFFQRKNNLNALTHQAMLRQYFPRLLAIGITGYYLASYLDFLGLQYISATLERLILFTYPTLVLLIGLIWLKKKVYQQQWIACFISYLGIALVFCQDLTLTTNINAILIGSMLVFLSALAYALYLILVGELIQKIGTLTLTCYASLIATIACFLQFGLIKDWHHLFSFSWQVYFLSLLNAVVCTVIPMFLVSFGISRCGAGIAAQSGMLGPMTTIFLGIALLNEHFSWIHALGTIIVLSGMYLYSKTKKAPT